jgi:uncharacterized membrane protein
VKCRYNTGTAHALRHASSAMTPLRHLAALLLAAAFALPASAQADDNRRQFGRWTVSCAANAYCTASTRLSGAGGAPYAYQLRVSRFESGSQEIALLVGVSPPAPDAAIAVAVDTRTRLTLEPAGGYRRVAGGNTFVLEQAATDQLLPAMRKGRRISFTYQTSAGKRAQAAFPLAGFAQAMTVAGIQAAPTTAAQPPSVGPVEQQAKPEPTPRAAPAAPEPARETAPTTQRAEPVAPPPEQRAEPAPRAAAPAAPEPQRPAAVLPPPSLDIPPPVTQVPPADSGTGRKRTKAVMQFACRGNEPGWSLVIDRDDARYLALRGSEPDAVALKGKLRVTGEGRRPDVDWRGKAADGSAYRVLIQEQACKDTMADAGTGEGQSTFPYRARLTLPGGQVVQGCCNAGLETARPQPAAPVNLDQAPVANLFGRQPDDWSRFLLELKPAIDACVQRTPGESPYVTKAWPMNRGLVGVRTRNAVAGWFDCVADYDGRGVERFEAVTADAGPAPGEGSVLYTPVAGRPPGGSCWRHERVQDTSGNPLGWLSTNDC